MSKQSIAVVVVGMHRSGTSVVARGLTALGAYLGEELIPPASDNRKGFFEDASIVQLNEELLSAVGVSWDSFTIPVIPTSVYKKFEVRAKQVLQEKFSGHQFWAMKDPRVTRLVNFWDDVLSALNVRVVYVLCVRSPESVAASLQNRNGMPMARGLLLWLLHLEDALRFLGARDRVHVVADYDRMLADPRGELSRIGGIVGVSEVSAVEMDRYVSSFLDHSLRHHSYKKGGEDDCRPPFSRDIENCYLRSCSIESTEEVLDVVVEIKRKYCDVIQSMDVMDKQSKSKIIAIQSELIACRRELGIERSRLTWIESRWPYRLWKKMR